ncbi:MAG: hypothetical protein RLZZ58_1914 [Pseudomonadota bacterium]|jgi:cell wall-associated NlpC family hydrolase
MICSPAIPVDSVGARIFAAAQALVGTRFRLHGRDPATGVDCIGLALCAHAGAGVVLAAPDDYPLRGWPRARVENWILRAGLVRADGALRPGDVPVIDAGFGQWHFGIAGPGMLVHADARRRRVIQAPWHGDDMFGCWRAA